MHIQRSIRQRSIRNGSKTALLLLGGILVASCTSSRTASEITATEVEPSGGIAKSADGLMQLELPEDALSHTSTITIEILRDDPRTTLLSPVYRFTPADLTLTVAGTLRAYLSRPPEQGVTLADVSAADPTPLPGAQSDAGVLTASIKKLSSFAVLAATVYEPCAGKSCGDNCSICPPGASDCNEDAVIKACDAEGQCVAKTPDMCGTYDPCAGKKCGDSCTVCQPGDPDCNETGEIKGCNPQGQCVSHTPDMCGTYDPCAGKKCGDSCTICPPGASDCNEDAVIKACNPEGQCVAETPGTCPICEASSLPQCIVELIAELEAEPVANPPASLTQYEYKGQCVYYLPPRCCDIPSVLYDDTCNVICAPDGGLSGAGDGKCPDFFNVAVPSKAVWQDSRH